MWIDVNHREGLALWLDIWFSTPMRYKSCSDYLIRHCSKHMHPHDRSGDEDTELILVRR
jgi:hypothetical protein